MVAVKINYLSHFFPEGIYTPLTNKVDSSLLRSSSINVVFAECTGFRFRTSDNQQHMIRTLFSGENLITHVFLSGNYSILTTFGGSVAFCLVGVLLPSCSVFLGIRGLPAAFRPVWGLEEPAASLRWSSGLLEPLCLAGVNKESMSFSDLRLSRPQK